MVRGMAYLLVIAVTIGLALAYFIVGETGPRDLLGNFLAEALGVFFTIAIVDTLLRQAEFQRNRPVRVAAYQRSLRVLNSILQLWTHMVIHASTKMPAPNSSIFEAEITREVAQHLRLDGRAPILPAMTWRAYLVYEAKQIKASIKECQQLVSAFLSPALVVALEDVSTMPFIAFSEMGEVVAGIHTGMGLMKMQVMSYDLASPEAPDVRYITNLHRALSDEYRVLAGEPGVAAVPALTFDPQLVATPSANLGKSRYP